MKSRVLSASLLFFLVMMPLFAARSTSHEVCEECERERLSLACDWRSFPVDMAVEDFDYHGPSKIHSMLGKAQERIRSLKNNAQREIEGVKESVEEQLKNIEQDAGNQTALIAQQAHKEIASSLQDAQRKSDDAKLNSFSTMIQIKYNAHQQALELMQEAEKEVVRTMYQQPGDANRIVGAEAQKTVAQKTEDKPDEVAQFDEYLSYIEDVIRDGEPDESARNEMLALCEKQKKSFKERFAKHKNDVDDPVHSRFALFERICKSHRAAVAPLDEQAHKNVLSKDHVKKMKLILLYDIQQTLALPFSQPSQQSETAPAQPVLPAQPEVNTAISLENSLISELNKRLARVEQHLRTERKKTQEYAAKLAHANGMLRKAGATHNNDFEKLQQKYLSDMEFKERENLEMRVALKRLEDSLTQRQEEPSVPESGVAQQQTKPDKFSAQERDHWGSVIESIKQEKLNYEVKSGVLLSEKEELMKNVAELTGRIVSLQNDLVIKQKEYEKALQAVESESTTKVTHSERTASTEKEDIREKQVRADLAQAELRERMKLASPS